MEKGNIASTVMSRYKHGLNYQKEFLGRWTECTDFKEGRQWPAPTERTRNLPRPVINITAFIIRHKKSNLLSEQIKFVFSPQEVQGEDLAFNPMQQMQMQQDPARATEGARMFTQYAQVVWEATWKAAGCVLRALIAYDNCEKYLKMSYDQLLMWSELDPHPACVLLLPYLFVKEKIEDKEIENV